jgi:hypothetical protein
MSQIDILVYCHIYDNKFLGEIPIPHPPVFLFLYNESTNTYDKIELNRENMDNLKKKKNIYITFIDQAADIDIEYGYQKNDISQLEGRHFDYIFPINCPFATAGTILKLLKPNGQYLYNDYPITTDSYDNVYKDRGMNIDQFNDMVERNRSKLIFKSKTEKSLIEFNDYRSEKRPYIFKTDIDTGLGWYKIYTRDDIPKPSVSLPRPTTESIPAPATESSSSKSENEQVSIDKCTLNGCTVSGGRKRTKRTNRPKKRKTIKKKQKQKKQYRKRRYISNHRF